MNTVSASAVARELGTSAPRVIRAIDRLGLRVDRDRGGRLRLRPAEVDRLRRELGSTPRLPGLSKTDTLILGALSRAPLGLTSARAVAARAGVAPTTAGNALVRLIQRGLATEETRVVAAGRARPVRLFRANVAHPDWPRLAPALIHVTPRRSSKPKRPKRVPPRLRHLFWNTADEQLDVARQGGYIARRLLTSGDLDGLSWGAAHLGREQWRHAQRARGLPDDRRALAENLASAGR